MDLSNARHLTASGCFVCGHAGKALVIWPQQPLVLPVWIEDNGVNYNHNDSFPDPKPSGWWLPGKWAIYLTSYDPDIRSGKKRIEACLEHYNEIGRDWIAIAQAEIDLENQWHSYVDRVEQ